MASRSYTQKEIARNLGISQALVSQVLSGRRKVATHLHEQILQEGKRLKYQPNHAALSLRTGRQRVWGLLIPSFSHLGNFNRQVVQGIWEVAERNRHSVSVTCFEGENSAQADIMRLLQEGRFDGLFMVYESDTSHISYERIQEMGVPLVVVNCPLSNPRTHVVCSDGSGGVCGAVRHLIDDHNRRRVAYLSRVDDSWLMEDRYAGYLRALEEADIAFDERRVYHHDPLMTIEDNCELAIAGLLDSRVPFDAVYCPTDYFAFSTMAALQRRGLRVPDDVAVIGFDDHPISAGTNPRLTTIRCDGFEMGRTSARIMIEALHNNKPLEIQRIRMPVSLVRRESCGCGCSDQ